MSFDYKKEYREFYLPKSKPSIVTIPVMNYIVVRGAVDPKQKIEESGGLLALRKEVEAAGGEMIVDSLPEFRLTIRLFE